MYNKLLKKIFLRSPFVTIVYGIGFLVGRHQAKVEMKELRK